MSLDKLSNTQTAHTALVIWKELNKFIQSKQPLGCFVYMVNPNICAFEHVNDILKYLKN